ncbi:signal peptide peptidase SppA [Undibacterium sp. Jales W-56]|uniref:signal peptide peptidase SppA n=1 Tax=Undibacterium sp. Jales W-56 TaxID=2897325 RepID=UPI0021D0A06E|nr:signal peptide peptidase SppA [Undibacterium sp. Jales W-56]MCU6435574.1 signal peptide peptidase SppA [Undibacterium sp. Jales W-56]
MSFSPFRWIKNSIVFVWRTLDFGRRLILNLLLLALLIAIAIGIFSGSAKKIDDKTALLLDLKGTLVEQNAGNLRDNVLAEAQGTAKKSTQLRDILTVLDAAGKDPKITSAVLLLDEMQGAGLPMLREVAAAIERFKANGKTVVAWGSSYDQRQYYLASHANEVYLHPMGNIMLTGFGRYRNYYRDALDKIGITVNLLKVGTYKSFAEPYIANEPSAAATEAESFLYNAMWATYTGDVEKARKLPAGSIMQGINQLPELLQATNGDVAKMALNIKLVDGLKTRDELRQLMIGKGVKDDQSKSFKQVGFDDYLARQIPKFLGDAVGVVVASGEISEGMAPAGSIGGLSTANLIRKAREDEQIKAIVLRVDSPGGSAFGSELIRRELELTRNAGKPVVVSMGNVAASGGYWISMSADEVIADATTVTGSIGVFAILPTAEKALDKIGVHTGGTTTTWLGDGFNPLRPLNPKFGEVIQASINHIYDDFTTKAAKARKTTPDKIDAVAQGRVWTGQQAKERGLIDTVGSYGDAIKSAAARAKLGKDFRISYIEREPSKFDRIFNMFGASFAQVLSDQFKVALVPTGLPPAAATQIAQELSWLGDLNKEGKGYAVMTHCLCSVP